MSQGQTPTLDPGGTTTPPSGGILPPSPRTSSSPDCKDLICSYYTQLYYPLRSLCSTFIAGHFYYNWANKTTDKCMLLLWGNGGEGLFVRKFNFSHAYTSSLRSLIPLIHVKSTTWTETLSKLCVHDKLHCNTLSTQDIKWLALMSTPIYTEFCAVIPCPIMVSVLEYACHCQISLNEPIN